MWSRTYISMALATVTAAATADTVYVDTNCGNDAWAGTSPVCQAPDGPKATIQAGLNAAADGDEVVLADGVYAGPGNAGATFGFEVRQITLRSANGASGCIVDGGELAVPSPASGSIVQGLTIQNGVASFGGGGLWSGADLTVLDCVFQNNEASVGGGVLIEGNGEVRSCVFIDNVGEVAAGLRIYGDVILDGSLFRDNVTTAGAAGFFHGRDDDEVVRISNCVFEENDGGGGLGGGGGYGLYALWTNCVFRHNVSSFNAGALALTPTEAHVVNTVIASNSSGMDGGAVIQPAIGSVINSTFHANANGGLNLFGPARNSIFWANTGFQVQAGNVQYSNIQGGAFGEGNIDADPLFVQAGTGDFRLAEGSPCLDAGSNAALPNDEADLDGDGVTDEPLPVDLVGAERVQNGTVDMGALEGAHAATQPVGAYDDLDQGEWAILVPDGTTFNPTVSPAVGVFNLSGGDNATISVTQIDVPMHAGAGGYSEVGSVLSIETSMNDGEYLAIVYLPFEAVAIGGADPLTMNLTVYDPGHDTWALAPWGNSASSPGYSGPIGDRFISTDPTNWGVGGELGDYGVFWHELVQRGFVWAKVDSFGDMAVGAALCPSDCLQSPNGRTDVLDFLALLYGWGGAVGGNPCDLNGDAAIDQIDLLALLDGWGQCSVVPASAPTAAPVLAFVRSADVSGNGTVDHADIEAIKATWGPCPGCPTDLDNDGVVGARDMTGVLGQWGTSAE